MNLDPRITLVFSSRGTEEYPSQVPFYSNFTIEQSANPVKILLLELGYNKESEASDFECVLPKKKSLILVTPASHITKAKIIFFNYGLEIFPVPSDSIFKIYPAGNSSILIPTVRLSNI